MILPKKRIRALDIDIVERHAHCPSAEGIFGTNVLYFSSFAVPPPSSALIGSLRSIQEI